MSPQRCPKCKRGEVLEWMAGWWCSRRYDYPDACDWIAGEAESKRLDAGIPAQPREIPEWRCTATKADGSRCTRYAGTMPRLCWQHEEKRR